MVKITTPMREHPAAAEAVTRSATHQEKRAEHQLVRFDDPLRRQRAVARQRPLQRGQCDIDDGAIDEHHARRQYGGGENPRLGFFLRTAVRSAAAPMTALSHGNEGTVVT